MFWQNTTRWVLPARGDGPAWEPEAGWEGTVVAGPGDPFTDLVASWNAETPAGTGLRVDVRVYVGPVDGEPEAGTWTPWYTLGHWGQGERRAERWPRSVASPDADGGPVRLAIDTLTVAEGYEATAWQPRLTLYGGDETPVVRLLAVSTAHRGRVTRDPAQDPPLGQDVALVVPARSQQVEHAAIAGEICSPTSVGMLLEFYGRPQPTAQVAAAVFDHGAEIYGNWPFNVAYAGSLGLRAVVRHFAALQALERELQQGHPVVISIAFAPGELPEAPIARSNGHLLVVTGVTAGGDFRVNDPAAHPGRGQALARVYTREHLRRVFLEHGGVGYVITPQPEATPAAAQPGRSAEPA